MLIIRKLFILASLILGFPCIASANQQSYHSVQVGITQQSQQFEFESGDKTLNIQGYRLGYQYGFNDWRFSVDYNEAEGDDSNTLPKNELTFENAGYSLFAEYSWSNCWLALGYSASKDKTGFSFKRPDIQGGFNTNVDYQNIILDTGYVHYMNSGQWTLASSLTRQQVDEKKQAQSIKQNSTVKENNTQIDESAWLASLGINYSHYFSLTQAWELSLAAGLNHQLTLDGEGRIQQTSQHSTAISSRQNSSSEVITENQSSSTSQQLQVSFLHNRGNISFDLDKLSNQSFDDAYYSIGLGVNF